MITHLFISLINFQYPKSFCVGVTTPQTPFSNSHSTLPVAENPFSSCSTLQIHEDNWRFKPRPQWFASCAHCNRRRKFRISAPTSTKDSLLNIRPKNQNMSPEVSKGGHVIDKIVNNLLALRQRRYVLDVSLRY